MRGGLDETLARLARREEALRRRAAEEDTVALPGTGAPPGTVTLSDPATAPDPVAAPGTTATTGAGTPHGGGRNAGPGWADGREAARTTDAGRPQRGTDNRDRPDGTPPPHWADAAAPPRWADVAGPAQWADVAGPPQWADAAGGQHRADDARWRDPVEEVAEVVRRVVAEHPGMAVSVRVDHDGQEHPLRVSWSGGIVTVSGTGAAVPPPPWPMSVKTVPAWTPRDGLSSDPAARLAEIIRQDPSLLTDDDRPR
ncbi:hypothetical protein ACTMSW_14625 [Micromonospora sp. BQ11]|uniref:hypothetical protein n=1 Tax=Micromonospora sp. BQ11 TaxID=3452212 RepID=UPI003F89B4BB